LAQFDDETSSDFLVIARTLLEALALAAALACSRLILANVLRTSVAVLFVYRNSALRMLCAGAELTSGLWLIGVLLRVQGRTFTIAA
jgi:hypothetical protein